MVYLDGIMKIYLIPKLHPIPVPYKLSTFTTPLKQGRACLFFFSYTIIFLYWGLTLLRSLSVIRFHSDSRKSFYLPVLVLEQEKALPIQNLRWVCVSASEGISGRSQMISDDRDIVSDGKWFRKVGAMDFAPQDSTIMWNRFWFRVSWEFQDYHDACWELIVWGPCGKQDDFKC